MAEGSDLEKTEPASPRRLEKAREEGQTARSRELVSFLILFAGVAGLWAGASSIFEGMRSLFRAGLGFDRVKATDVNAIPAFAVDAAWQALATMVPFLLLLAVVGVLGSILLGGFIFVTKPLQPDIARLSPLKGFKRIFSANTLVELIKAVFKALLVGVTATFALYYHLDAMMALMHQPTASAVVTGLRLVATCCGIIILSLALIALLDAPYQIWEHLRKLRMSRQDVRDEHKETEGDPHVKARIRQQQRAMARGRMMSAVPEADVVVTNPTHYAVALRYDSETMAAPRVVAKGTGLVAVRIRELAEEHGVPLLEAPPLARALYWHVDLDREIPEALYTAVAEVLAWVYQLRIWRDGDGVKPEQPRNLRVPDELDKRSE